jgi:cell division initiation protein
MPITPVDLRNVKFEKKFRGYSPSDVETTLNEVAGEMERLIDANSSLQRQVLSLEEKLKQLQNLEKSIKETLLTAQQAAEEKRKATDRSAEVQIRETEIHCAELKQKAHSDVETMKFELASLKMQKVRFVAELRSLIDAHHKLLEEKSQSENFAEVAVNVEAIRSGTSE